jgi:hypothetical protein
MKLFSKIISAVAALSMVATMAVMPVAHAAGATLKLTATPAEDQSYVDVVVSYSGLTEGMKTMGIVVNFDNSLFTYPSVSGSKFKKGSVAGWGTGLDEDQIDGGSITFAQQATQIKFAFTTTETDEEYLLHENCEDLMHMRFNVKDGADSSVWTDGYTFTFADSTIGSYKTYDSTLAMDTTDAKIGGAVVPVPVTYAVTAGEGIASVDKTEAAEGDTVNFTVAEAPANKQLADIKVNGESIGKEATSFTMPAAAATVTAVFEDIMYTVTGANGIALDKSTAKFGETVSITEIAIPVDKELVDITLNGESKGKNFSTFLMPAEDVTVAAVLQDKVVVPDPTVTFTSDEVSANNAVGFWSKLAAFEDAGEVKAAGFVFANVDEVEKPLQTSQIKVADTLDLGQTITYEFKNLTGYDKFGLKAMAYIVTEKGTFWSDFFGSLINIVK